MVEKKLKNIIKIVQIYMKHVKNKLISKKNY